MGNITLWNNWEINKWPVCVFACECVFSDARYFLNTWKLLLIFLLLVLFLPTYI